MFKFGTVAFSNQSIERLSPPSRQVIDVVGTRTELRVSVSGAQEVRYQGGRHRMEFHIKMSIWG